jgi:carbamoyl-phosphate synthase large subunit
MNIQIFLDQATEAMKIIELNPRFGGGFPLAWKAGAHYPRWLIEECLERPLSAARDCWEDGLVMLRWDAAVFVTATEVEALK